MKLLLTVNFIVKTVIKGFNVPTVQGVKEIAKWKLHHTKIIKAIVLCVYV